MKITVLNGNPDPGDTGFEKYLLTLAEAYKERGHSVETLTLRALDIKRCVGCFGCWARNPGRCSVKDDSAIVRRAYIGADLAVLASPVVMGFTSALLKRAQDKLIPLLLPGIEIAHGECHHVARYPKYPALGLLVDKKNADEEDLRIITDIFGRMAWNFKTNLAFARTTDDPAREVADEADRI